MPKTNKKEFLGQGDLVLVVGGLNEGQIIISIIIDVYQTFYCGKVIFSSEERLLNYHCFGGHYYPRDRIYLLKKSYKDIWENSDNVKK